MAPTPLLGRLVWVGFGKEPASALGTPVAPTFYVPVTSVKPSDVPIYVDDDSLVGSPGKVRGVYQGIKVTDVALDGYLFPDSAGSLLAMLGMFDSTTGTAGTKTGTTAALAIGATTATYTVVGGTAPIVGDVFQFDVAPNAELRTLTAVSGTGPYTLTWVGGLQYAHAAAAAANNVTGTSYTHGFKLPLAGTQPASWTITVWNNVVARQYPGQMADSLDFTIDAKGAAKWAAKFKGWPSSTTAKPTQSFPTTAAWLGWQGALTIGGVANPKPVSNKIGIKRTVDPFPTMANTQNPYSTFADVVEASWALKLLMTDEVDWNHAITNDQPTVVFSLTSPSGSPAPVLTLTSTVAAFKKSPPDFHGNPYQVIDADIVGVTNATDQGPIAATLVNGVVAGY